MKSFVIAAGLVIVVIIAILLIPNANQPAENPQPAQDQQQDEDRTLEQQIPSATNISMSVGDHFFSPSQITAQPGETLNIEISGNNGTHDFVIDELSINSGIFSGSRTVQVTIPENATPGTLYTFYCSVMNHRALGMEGFIEVI